jgi:AraC-like DNA-binding protein
MGVEAAATTGAPSVVDIDATDIEAFIARPYTWPQSDILQTGGGRFSGHLRYLKTATVDLNTRHFATPALAQWVVTDDRVHLAGPVRLDPETRLLGRPLGDTRTMLLAPGQEGFCALRKPGISWAIIIDRERLARELRLVHDCSLDAGLGHGWATAWTAGGLDLLVQRLLGDRRPLSPAALDALVVGAVADRLAGPGTPLVASAAYRLARRARDLLIDSAEAPLSLPALMAALGVGQRTVFNAFGSVFGMSPAAFQRALQLDRVRRRLLSAPPGATVTTLALDEGVEHLGRFAGAYRRQFGELPSETRRRALRERRPLAA